MSSLVPFEFRCVGHLTGVSLRCAPLHVTLSASPSRSSHTQRQQRRQRRRREVQRVEAASAGPSPLSPLALRRGDTTEPNSPEHRRLSREAAAQSERDSAVSDVQGSGSSGERGSPYATTLAAPAVTAATAAGAPSHPHTQRTSSPLPPHSSPLSDRSRTPSSHADAVHHDDDDDEEADATDGGAQELAVDLHNPALCLEVYYTLRVAAPLEASFAALGGGTTTADHEAAAKTNSPTPLAAPPPLHASEVSRGSAQPRWADLPPTCLAAHKTATQLDVAFFYTASCLSRAAALQASAATPTSSSPRVCADVCVHRCHVDMCDVVYAGATVEEADATLSRLLYLEAQPSHATSPPEKAPPTPKRSSPSTPAPRGFTRPLVLLLCADGVFLPRVSLTDFSAAALAVLEEMRTTRTHAFAPPPTAADLQMPSPTPSALHTIAGRSSVAATAASEIAAACTELPWSRAPSSVGWRYPPSAVPRANARRISAGDVKAAALATAAWQHLADLAEGRQAALADALDAEAAADPAGRAHEARHAALRVRLAAAREQLTLSTLELEAVQERVEVRQRQLQRQEEAHALLQSHLARTTSSEAQEHARATAREEEAQRARLRAQLARVRQQRARELCLVYNVELSNQYANVACARAADAKDHVNGCALPILFAGRAATDTGSQLVARSADDMHEEAVALGHAGHLLVVLSSLYSCALPHPIVLGSGQSVVLASPTVDAVQAMTAPYALTGARKYPLSCHKVGDRPLMMGGVRLLLRDGVALARAMGKPERRVLACSDRLGALLDLLLRDAE